MDILALNQRFGRTSQIKIVAGNGGLSCIQVSNDAADAEIYLQGAHVTKFQPKGQAPVLWMSGSSLFQPGKAIRGGIPLCWPWFGPNDAHPAFPAHGFARNSNWELVSAESSASTTKIILSLKSPAPIPEYFPSNFELSYEIEISSKLKVLLKYANLGTEAQTITEALHTYLTVSDVRKVGITGLAGITFIDKVKQQRIPEGAAPIAIIAETDRVYLNTTSPVDVTDAGMKRRIRVSKSGSNSTVVWNPWIEKSKKMADFGDDEWPGMLCIETANAHDNRVTLAAGQTHEIGTTVEVLPLSP